MKLIRFIYDNDSLQNPTAETLQEKAIVCPKNETAYTLNTWFLEMLQGETTKYTSFDEAVPHGNNGGSTEMLFKHHRWPMQR